MHRLDKILRTCEHPGRGPIHGHAALTQTRREAATERLAPASVDVSPATVAVSVATAVDAGPVLTAPASRAGRTW